MQLTLSNAQWQQTNGPYGAGTITCIAVSGTNIFAGTAVGGVFLSPDSGTTWTAVNNGLTDTAVTCLAIRGTNIFAGTSGGGVFLSSNNGGSWTAVNNGLTDTNITSLAISGTNILAGTLGGGVFLSIDTGANWTNTLPNTFEYNTSSLAASGSNIVAGSAGGFLFLSRDAGLTWSEIDNGVLPGPNISLAFNGSSILVGTGGYGVFLSNDTGLTWTAFDYGLLDSTVNSLLAVNGNIFAGTGGGIFLSANSGIWTTVNNGLTDTNITSLAKSGTNIFAGTNTAGVWKRCITLPAPSITDADYCGNSVLTATGFTGMLLWSTGETTSSITVTIAGTYFVTQTAGNCASPAGTGLATPGSVAAPAVTVIDYWGYSTLTATGFTGTLLWSTGETTSSITVTMEGSYSVSQTVGVCASPPAIGIATPFGVHQSDNTNAGNDFWFAFPSDRDVDSVTYSIVMTSFTNASGTVSIPGTGFNQNFTVIPGSVTRIVVPFANIIVSGPDVIANSAVHVIADSTIALFFEETEPVRNDNSYVLQNGVLGNDYYVMSYINYAGDGSISEFVVIAPGSPVRVEITPSVATLGGHPAGIPFDTTLLPGQLFQAQSYSDLTGSRVRSLNSTQKFAVIGANSMETTCAAGTIDPLFDQLIPVCSWGEHYVVVSTPNAEDICRVLASQNGTMININGNLAATLNAGQYYDTIVKPSSPFFITANNPISVARILQTEVCNNAKFALGDPDMILVDANEQMLLDSITFYATSSSNSIDSNYIQIVTRSPDTNTVFLDGQNVGSSFIPLPFDTSYSYTNLSTQEGEHHIMTSGRGFLAYQCGLGDPTSIGCAAGVYIIGNCVSVAPSFQASDSTICTNDCINFTNLSIDATSYQWTFTGAMPPTSNSANPQNICYLSAGTFNVTLVATNSSGSDSISGVIKVLPSPPTPTITQSHDTLVCSFDTSYVTYQWYDSTSVITGATNSFLVITHGGNYNLAVTNKSGCKISVGINIISGIQNYSNDNSVILYPNPATDQLLISGNWNPEEAKLSIFNVLGQVCSQEEIVNRKPEIVINVSSLSAGIYFLQMKTERGIDTQRFVKE